MLSLLGWYPNANVSTNDCQLRHIDIRTNALIILRTKCNVCHYKQNPGKVFTLANMDKFAPKIYKQVFVKRRMPKGNATKLTQEEEQTLMVWLQSQPLNK
jgi:uncharacterized membrane protein